MIILLRVCASSMVVWRRTMWALWAFAAAIMPSLRVHGYNETLGDGASTERLTTKRDEAKFFTFYLPEVRTTCLSNVVA